MANWSYGLLTGTGMGLFVSVIPGLNTALCVQLARRGARAATPLVLTVVVSDFSYCLLSSLGLLALAHAHTAVLHWMGLLFPALAAGAIWPRPQRRPRRWGYLALVAFNPSTLVLWMGLAALPGHPGERSVQAAGALALGALVGSGLWFCALAQASARLGSALHWLGGERAARFLSASLAGLSLIRLTLLFS